MTVVFFVAAFLAVALAQTCFIDAASTLAGSCTTRADCTGSGAAWVASSSWGRKTAWGCERAGASKRCCYRASTSTTKTTPTATTTTTKLSGTPPSTATTAKTGSSGALSGDRQAMLDFHNAERACFGAPPLTWDSRLENDALTYASKCKWEHDPNNDSEGENLAAGTGEQDSLTLVSGWLEEQFAWSCESGSCARGQVCGHYTQLIWATTTRVGCRTVMCHRDSPFGSRFPDWTFTVCRYDPPGNWVGEHPLAALRSRQCSCARSAKTQDAIWAAEGDDFQYCVLPESGAAGCVCPDSTQNVEGSCTPVTELPCVAPPKRCADGTTVYPKPPACSAECADASPASATAAVASLAAGALGAILVL